MTIKRENNKDQSHDTVDPYLSDFVSNILDMKDKTVADIMIPRVSIISADVLSCSLHDAVINMSRCKISHLVLYEKVLDNTVGLLHVYDALDVCLSQKDRIHSKLLDFRSYFHDILYVPDSIPVTKFFSTILEEKKSNAIVVDEYGGTVGMIILRDIVEVVIGNISHNDSRRSLVTQISPCEWKCDASVYLEDLRDILPENVFSDIVSQNIDVDTLGGIIFTFNGYIPKSGETVNYSKTIVFKILESNKRRVLSLIISYKDAK